MHLITFGDSWTYGSGIKYVPGMSHKEYDDIFLDNDGAIWRTLLSEKLDCGHTNFAYSGSSNQAQFRLLREFFNENQHKQHSDLVIFFGITSVYRTQIWDNSLGRLNDFLFTGPKDKRATQRIKKIWLKNTFNYFWESHELKNNILHWNILFDYLGVKIYWFDTFNHIPYYGYTISELLAEDRYNRYKGSEWPPYHYITDLYLNGIRPEILQEMSDLLGIDFLNMVIENFIDFKQNGRDQLTLLTRLNQIEFFQDNSHLSDFTRHDGPLLTPLVDKGLLNPYSYHPTATAHNQIAEYYYKMLRFRSK